MKILRSLLLLPLVAATFSACTSVRPPAPSGFIGDTTALRPAGPGVLSTANEVRPGVPAGSRGLVIEPVVFRGEAVAGPLPDRDRALFAATLERKLHQELEPHLALAAQAGPGVLRLRTAVTAVRVSEPVVNAASTLLVLVPVDCGGISVELELVDDTGHRIAATIAHRNGNVTQVFSGLRRTGQAEAAFAQIVRAFAGSIDWTGAPQAALPVVATR